MLTIIVILGIMEEFPTVWNALYMYFQHLEREKIIFHFIIHVSD